MWKTLSLVSGPKEITGLQITKERHSFPCDGIPVMQENLLVPTVTFLETDYTPGGGPSKESAAAGF